MSRDDCAGNAAAYVLGALEAGETAAYLRHLQTCPFCADEVTALGGVTEALPMTAPQYRVPRRLRRRVVRTVRAESRRPRARPRLRAAFAGALAVVLAVVAVGVLARGGGGGPKIIHAMVRGSTATAELRLSGGHAELVVRRMPPPPPGRIYEVWLRRHGAAPSPTTALFSVTTDGAADVGLPGGVRGVSEVLVTQEPAGGSRIPAGLPVILISTS
jgi:anti-sigma-K factor RskA